LYNALKEVGIIRDDGRWEEPGRSCYELLFIIGEENEGGEHGRDTDQ
jgi:hypothetical protein